MGFHGRAATDKPKITMHNAKLRLEWCKACCHWTLGAVEILESNWPNRPTSVPDFTNAPVAEWKQVPAAMFQHIAAKGDQLHINARDFGMRCSTSRCPHTFGNVVHLFI